MIVLTTTLLRNQRQLQVTTGQRFPIMLQGWRIGKELERPTKDLLIGRDRDDERPIDRKADEDRQDHQKGMQPQA